MKKEYDFTNGIRGKFYRPGKVQKTIRLDADIVSHFQSLAEKKHTGYQTLINLALRDAIGQPSGLVDIKVLRKELNAVLQNALSR